MLQVVPLIAVLSFLSPSQFPFYSSLKSHSVNRPQIINLGYWHLESEHLPAEYSNKLYLRLRRFQAMKIIETANIKARTPITEP